ncbi:MAG: c-type cytochrome, partial [Planctomycetota bacterium]
MNEQEAKEPIKLYLDDDDEPFKVATPPLTFQFNTIALPDGPHRLRVEASNGLAPPTIKEIPFTVRNGVAVSVSGLEAQQTIAGQVQMVINAYAGSTEVDFEPRQAETPQPIPTWAWVLFLGVLAWTMFYVINPTLAPRGGEAVAQIDDRALGERIFADTCARCHGEIGQGLSPTVPALKDAAMAVAKDPDRLLAKVATGTRIVPVSEGPPPEGKQVIMPPWGPRLTNEEIVAV